MHRALVVLAALALSIACGCDAEAPGAGNGSATHQTPQLRRGAEIYARTCAGCHGADGTGLPGVFPPLAASDWLAARPMAAIDVVLRGLKGRITVNGRDYESVMPPMNHLDDAAVADALTFVLNSWGNPGGTITAAEVAAARAAPPRELSAPR